jgi:hypothetical protein
MIQIDILFPQCYGLSHDYSLHDRGSGPEREIILPFVKSLILTLKVAELPT